MPNLPISGLPTATSLDGTELLPFVQGGVTTQATAQDILDANLPVTSSGITVSGDIVPTTPQGATLGSIAKPFAELYLQSGSISIESDTPGDPSALISNVNGNLEVSVGGMLLVESGSSFTSPTGSFEKLSAGLTENYIWIGDSNNKNIETPVSSLPGYFPFNYGLFNQTGSSSPVSGSTHVSGSLIGGGVGTLSVPANGFTKGDAYQATFSGVVNAENNKTLEITVKAGDVVLADTGVISMPGITGDKRWRMDIDFSIREVGGTGTAEIATAGTVQFRTDSSGDVITEIFSDVNNTTFDTTINNTLTVEAEWGNGQSDLSSIYSKLFTLLKTY